MRAYHGRASATDGNLTNIACVSLNAMMRSINCQSAKSSWGVSCSLTKFHESDFRLVCRCIGVTTSFNDFLPAFFEDRLRPNWLHMSPWKWGSPRHQRHALIRLENCMIYRCGHLHSNKWTNTVYSVKTVPSDLRYPVDEGWTPLLPVLMIWSILSSISNSADNFCCWIGLELSHPVSNWRFPFQVLELEVSWNLGFRA